ncbi:hypothetical protein ACQ4PT_029989 [Festuca glaucescens]
MATAVSKQWTRMRTLGRGASGAEVFLAADDKSGKLFAVKSVCAFGASALRREQTIMSDLRSQRVMSCIGGRPGRDGTYQLFLEFTPGGSLVDEVARSGGALDECAIRRYAADVATGLVYLHGAGTVHGDGKARNVVIGADGCLRPAYGGAAAGLLEHPFLASAGVDAKLEEDVKNKWVSPKSTLDAALWESESDTEDELSVSQSSAERIKALACPASALPDWDSDEGWMDVLSAAPMEAQDAAAVPAE